MEIEELLDMLDKSNFNGIQEELMDNSINIEVAYNGVILKEKGYGKPTLVFTKDQKEEFLTKIYQLCFLWKVGDKVKIEREE